MCVLADVDEIDRRPISYAAMQKTLKHNATVMAPSFHLVGYSKSSSSLFSGVGLATELGRELFSPVPVIGAAASTAAVDAGRTVSTGPLFSLPVVF
ncbi:hypothetical protein GGP41_002376 [Bipolaris sorokiniana]|uniref:Uncharacterized protein n=1 Tax=Cochliobolus sativus TaxID=45130 RepID=A0A8H5ZH35_COCSA|nr:hypothetical protein GGP41_002376 [Bipolaris sorokiniana]